ncbi:MAG: potassium channel family protein [Jatrophihabitantaceae bacterium]
MSRVARWERTTEWPLAVNALVFLGAFAWPILDSGLDGFWREVCRYADYAAWAIFLLDYLIRLALAEQRLRYASKHIPDLLMVALPVLRPLRLLRVLLLLRVLNRRAAQSLRGRVAIYVSGSATLVLCCAALAELDAERHSSQANIRTIGESLWWAATTMSTVGYGDYHPVTTEGRLVAVGLMLAGVALLGVVTASIAAWLIETVREVETESQAATRADLARLHTEIAELRALLTDRAG